MIRSVVKLIGYMFKRLDSHVLLSYITESKLDISIYDDLKERHLLLYSSWITQKSVLFCEKPKPSIATRNYVVAINITQTFYRQQMGRFLDCRRPKLRHFLFNFFYKPVFRINLSRMADILANIKPNSLKFLMSVI